MLTPHLIQPPNIPDRGSWSRGAGRSRPKLRCFYYCANTCLNKPWAIQKTFAFFHSSKWWWIFWDEKPRVPPSYLTAPTLPIFSPLYFLCFNYKHLGLGLLVCGRSVSQKVFKTRFAFNVRGGQPSTQRNKQKQQKRKTSWGRAVPSSG